MRVRSFQRSLSSKKRLTADTMRSSRTMLKDYRLHNTIKLRTRGSSCVDGQACGQSQGGPRLWRRGTASACGTPSPCSAHVRRRHPWIHESIAHLCRLRLISSRDYAILDMCGLPMEDKSLERFLSEKWLRFLHLITTCHGY